MHENLQAGIVKGRFIGKSTHLSDPPKRSISELQDVRENIVSWRDYIDLQFLVFFSTASVVHERKIVLVLFVETGMGCPTGRGIMRIWNVITAANLLPVLRMFRQGSKVAKSFETLWTIYKDVKYLMHLIVNDICCIMVHLKSKIAISMP